MLVLYDNPASVAAQKVRMTLAEKGLAWRAVTVDLRDGSALRPEYLAINPQGVVPTLVDDGAVIVESSVIVEYLDDRVPAPPLRPAAPLDRARMRAWMRRTDDAVHRATGNVSMSIYIRHAHLARTAAERDAHFAAMPDRDRAERQQAAIALGLASPAFAPSLHALAGLVDDLDRALAGAGDGAWLAGDAFGLADIAVAPYLTRMQMLGLSPLWADGRRPAVAGWWDRVRARPSWRRTVHDAFAPAARAAMREHGARAWPAIAPILGLDPARPAGPDPDGPVT